MVLILCGGLPDVKLGPHNVCFCWHCCVYLIEFYIAFKKNCAFQKVVTYFLNLRSFLASTYSCTHFACVVFIHSMPVQHIFALYSLHCSSTVGSQQPSQRKVRVVPFSMLASSHLITQTVILKSWKTRFFLGTDNLCNLIIVVETIHQHRSFLKRTWHENIFAFSFFIGVKCECVSLGGEMQSSDQKGKKSSYKHSLFYWGMSE